MQYRLLCSIFCFVVAQVAHAQCNPKEYTRIFSEAQALQEKGQFIDAKNTYEAAKIFACNQKEKDAADGAVDRLFEEIEQLRQVAQRERERADFAKYQSDSLFKISDNEKKRAEAALDKIYFYQDKFGLSYDNSIRKYGFIDKNTNVKIRFKYDEARSFDPQGLAQVGKDIVSKNLEGKNLVQYLIDTIGNEYPLELRKGRLGADTKAIDFSYSKIFMIPIKVTNQEQLRVLRINYCKIKKVPKRIRKLRYLNYVQLRNNRIKELHEKIGELINLQSFDLSGNRLTILPESLSELINLKVLNLNDNQIIAIPKGIGNLKNLQFLNLQKNKLTSLPVEISKLENLQILNLRENRISTLPEEVINMKQLIKIDLGKNPCLVAYVEQLQKNMPWCEIIF